MKVLLISLALIFGCVLAQPNTGSENKNQKQETTQEQVIQKTEEVDSHLSNIANFLYKNANKVHETVTATGTHYVQQYKKSDLSKTKVALFLHSTASYMNEVGSKCLSTVHHHSTTHAANAWEKLNDEKWHRDLDENIADLRAYMTTSFRYHRQKSNKDGIIPHLVDRLLNTVTNSYNYLSHPDFQTKVKKHANDGYEMAKSVFD